MSSILDDRAGAPRLRPPRLRSLDWREPAGDASRPEKTDEAPSTGRAPRRWSLALWLAAYDRLQTDNGDGLAASLAFGALLSIAPLMFIVLAVASLLLGEGGAREQLESLVRDSLGSRAVPVLSSWIDDARSWSGSATLLGFVLFVIGSARLVGLVDAAFQTVFDVPQRAPESLLHSLRRYLTTQIRSVLVTLAAGALMIVSIVLRALGHSITGDDGVIASAWPVLREVFSFLVWLVALAFVYRVLPPVRLNRGDVLEGAAVSAALVSLTLLVLRLGASTFDFGAAYGAAGAVVGTLVTLYVVSQLFLYGAELTAELASRRGQDVRSGLDGCPTKVPPPKHHEEEGKGEPS
jgi:membrane protein